MECLQRFSDKSQTFSKARSFVFYSLHVTLLNFPENQPRSRILSGRTFCLYFPAEHQRKDERASTTRGSNNVRNEHSKVISKTEILQNLNESISLSLEALIEIAVKELKFKTSDRTEILFHLILSSYIVDLPESEDMFSMKRGTQTISPCHNCLVWNKWFNSNQLGKKGYCLGHPRYYPRWKNDQYLLKPSCNNVPCYPLHQFSVSFRSLVFIV